MGVVSGLCCLGCCRALMLLLFLGGVMKLWWITAITGFVLLETLAHPARRAAAVPACCSRPWASAPLCGKGSAGTRCAGRSGEHGAPSETAVVSVLSRRDR